MTMHPAFALAALLSLALLASARAEEPAALRLEDLRATRERPLFSPARRAPEAPMADVAMPDTPPAPVVEPPAFNGHLVGVILGDGLHLAVMSIEGQTRRMRPGDEASGWRLATVEPRRAVFERDGERREVALSSAPAPAPEASPAALSPESGGSPPDGPGSARDLSAAQARFARGRGEGQAQAGPGGPHVRFPEGLGPPP